MTDAEIIEEYRKASEDKRYSLFLYHRHLRGTFNDIHAQEDAREELHVVQRALLRFVL